MQPRAQVSWIIALMLSVAGTEAGANSYEWIRLQKLPAPGEIVAFANRPPRSRNQTLSRAEVMTFLSRGTLQTDPLFAVPFIRDNPPGHPLPNCRGVFITEDGMAYFWTLEHAQVLKLVTSEGRRCFVSLPSPGISPTPDPQRTDAGTHRKMKVPATGSIRWFFQDEAPPTDFSVEAPKVTVLKLIKEGSPVPCTSLNDEVDLQDKTWFTLPAKLAAFTREYCKFPMRGDAVQIGMLHMQVQVQGIMATAQGKIFYWEQWGDKMLALRDDAGSMCLFQIAP